MAHSNELFEFSQLRPRRELQAARLWDNEEGDITNIWLAANMDLPAVDEYRGKIDYKRRLKRQAGLRRRFGGN
jgi:hypothetical protein